MKLVKHQELPELGVSHNPEIKKRTMISAGEIPQLMMFSSIASIMFPDVPEFATVTKSIVYLFGAALGKNRS